MIACPTCGASMEPKPVPGAARFPRRLECPDHGWPNQNLPPEESHVNGRYEVGDQGLLNWQPEEISDEELANTPIEVVPAEIEAFTGLTPQRRWYLVLSDRRTASRTAPAVPKIEFPQVPGDEKSEDELREKYLNPDGSLKETGVPWEALSARRVIKGRPGRRDRLMEIQVALILVGAYNGQVNGVWDASCAEALKHFQKLQGLEPTGRFNKATLRKLLVGVDPAPESNFEAADYAEAARKLRFQSWTFTRNVARHVPKELACEDDTNEGSPVDHKIYIYPGKALTRPEFFSLAPPWMGVVEMLLSQTGALLPPSGFLLAAYSKEPDFLSDEPSSKERWDSRWTGLWNGLLEKTKDRLTEDRRKLEKTKDPWFSPNKFRGAPSDKCKHGVIVEFERPGLPRLQNPQGCTLCGQPVWIDCVHSGFDGDTWLEMEQALSAGEKIQAGHRPPHGVIHYCFDCLKSDAAEERAEKCAARKTLFEDWIKAVPSEYDLKCRRCGGEVFVHPEWPRLSTVSRFRSGLKCLNCGLKKSVSTKEFFGHSYPLKKGLSLRYDQIDLYCRTHLVSVGGRWLIGEVELGQTYYIRKILSPANWSVEDVAELTGETPDAIQKRAQRMHDRIVAYESLVTAAVDGADSDVVCRELIDGQVKEHRLTAAELETVRRQPGVWIFVPRRRKRPALLHYLGDQAPAGIFQALDYLWRTGDLPAEDWNRWVIVPKSLLKAEK